MKEKESVAGGCACGAIRLGFIAPAIFQAACHCRACQYTSGGGPAYLVGARKDQFRVTKGSPVEFMTMSDANNAVTRAFCDKCGTQLYSWSDETPEQLSIKVGCLDDPYPFRPRLHLWTSEAQRWHKRHWFARRFPKNASSRFERSPGPQSGTQSSR